MSNMKWQDVVIILATIAVVLFTIYSLVTISASMDGGITEKERLFNKDLGRALIASWVFLIPALGGYILKKLGYVKKTKLDNLQSATQTENILYQETPSKIIQEPLITKQPTELKQLSPSTEVLPIEDSTDRIRFCSSCGYKLDEDAKYCRSCGRKIE